MLSALHRNWEKAVVTAALGKGQPTPKRRLLAAAAAAFLAFLLVEGTLRLWLGATGGWPLMGAFASAGAAAAAAATTRIGRSIAFGFLGAFHLLFAVLATVLTTAAVCIG